MGLWINSAGTTSITAKLDWKFSDARLKKIRSIQARLDRFNPQKVRTLRRIAYKMRMWPGGNAYSEIAKKWYGFLLNLERNEPLIHSEIRNQIWDALNDSTFASIKFVAVEGPSADFEHQDLGTGNNRVKLLVLTTQAHDGSLGTEPPRDRDEPSGEPSDPSSEDPPSPPPFSSTKRKKAAKKARKKAAKKPGKKKSAKNKTKK